jgi:hypothetical protein
MATQVIIGYQSLEGEHISLRYVFSQATIRRRFESRLDVIVDGEEHESIPCDEKTEGDLLFLREYLQQCKEYKATLDEFMARLEHILDEGDEEAMTEV